MKKRRLHLGYTTIWFWQFGLTVKRGKHGFCLGAQWPIYQRCGWGP